MKLTKMKGLEVISAGSSDRKHQKNEVEILLNVIDRFYDDGDFLKYETYPFCR